MSLGAVPDDGEVFSTVSGCRMRDGSFGYGALPSPTVLPAIHSRSSGGTPSTLLITANRNGWAQPGGQIHSAAVPVAVQPGYPPPEQAGSRCDGPDTAGSTGAPLTSGALVSQWAAVRQ